MRKLIPAATVVALLAGLCVVATSADATVTAPSNGSVIAGSVTVTDSPGGTKSGTLCITGGNPSTKLALTGTGVNTTLASNGGGSLSTTLVTENEPNGTYTITGTEVNVTGTVFCSSHTSTSTVSVRIDNVVAIAYSGATSAPQGSTIAVSATLTDPNESPGALSGRLLTFALSGGTSVSATTDSNGVASANLPISGPPRSATLSVSYAGTTFYDAKTQNVSFAVTQDPTSTTVSPTTAAVHGQPVSFSATVAPTGPSVGTPTGSVQFQVDGTNFGSPVGLVNGVATSTATTTLSTASHAVTAVYSGDANYLGSASSAVTQVVNKAATTTSLLTAPNPTVSGQAVTLTATVHVTAPGAGAPTGGVQFFIDSQPFGTAVSLSGNTASLTVSNLSVGNHQVSATYDGDANFALSNSATETQGVDKAASSTSVASSDPNAVYGEPVSYTATVAAVAPGAGTPTGTVQFSVDGINLGSPVQLVNGVAQSAQIASMGPGNHNVVAAYSGDGDFGGSTGSYSQAVRQASTTTTVTSSANPSVFGQPVTYHVVVAAVAPGAGTPTGTVQLLINGSPVGSPVGLVNGAADTAPVADLAPGTYSVSVAYSGDVDFLTSASAALSQVVNKAATTTSLTSDANPSVFGQPVTFTATVAVVAPGAGSPSGTVTFTDGTTTLGVIPVSASTGEVASLTTSALSVAQHAITATYNGDPDFLGSNKSLTQTVLKAQTSTVVTSSVNPAQTGQPVSFSAQVTPVAPGAGLPTGTIVFTVNGAPLGSPALLTNGVATSTAFASLSPGNYSIVATYSGDGNFVGSQGQLGQGTGQNITQGSTSASLSSSPQPAAYGATVTFTATVSAVAPATGTPSGVVDFYDGGVLLGASQLAGGGSGTASAMFADSTLASGTHNVTADYVGNYNFTASSASTSETVGAVPTITGLTSSESPSVYGDTVTFTASVNASPASAGTPNGTVTFSDGSTVLGTATLTNVQGAQQASFSLSSLEAGTHTITAAYSGGGAFAGSSATLTQSVSKAASTLTAQVLIADQVALSRDGVRLHLALGEVSAYLTGNGHPLAGQTLVFTTLSFQRYVIPVCTAVTDANGFAECDASSANMLPTIISNGGYQVSYGGSADFTGSTAEGALDQ